MAFGGNEEGRAIKMSLLLFYLLLLLCTIEGHGLLSINSLGSPSIQTIVVVLWLLSSQPPRRAVFDVVRRFVHGAHWVIKHLQS